MEDLKSKTVMVAPLFTTYFAHGFVHGFLQICVVIDDTENAKTLRQ